MTSMRTIKVWIADGMVTVKAAPTPTPGLFVNEDPRVRDSWNVTHLGSGCAVAARLDNPEQALDLAIKLGPVCDWTMPAMGIRDSASIQRRWQRVLDEARIQRPEDYTVIPTGRLAGMEPHS